MYFEHWGYQVVAIKCLVRGDKNVPHYWNFILDENDSTYFTSIGQNSKNLEKAETYWDPKGKVYRETFSLNRNIQQDLKVRYAECT